MPDGLNGVAWPSIRSYFNLPVDALGSLLVMFTIGYLVSSFSGGRLLSFMSVGTLLALSCLTTAVSLIGYALAAAWPVMVTLGVLGGLGAGAIDAGLNTFAATQFSARMVNWLHACYGVGAASGPVIMTETGDRTSAARSAPVVPTALVLYSADVGSCVSTLVLLKDCWAIRIGLLSFVVADGFHAGEWNTTYSKSGVGHHASRRFTRFSNSISI